MIAGGSVTIYVADMERAVRFYTETLGLRLLHRGGSGYAAIDAGGGLELGLHATHPGGPRPGPGGGLQLSLTVAAPIGEVVSTLRSAASRSRTRGRAAARSRWRRSATPTATRSS